MEVGSVSSSLYASTMAASTQNVQTRTRQPEQTAQTQAPPAQATPQATPQAASTERTQPTSNTSESESAVSAQVEAQRNRPTVNLNGQLVGTRVNTTA